ncbi:hypothetical protein ACT4UT_34510, partial [Bacillus sp. B-TM1]
MTSLNQFDIAGALATEYGFSVRSVEVLSMFSDNFTYGSLGCIWRESVHHYLDEQEDAVPFNGLYAKEKEGTPVIDAWLNKYGIENWLRLLIQKA